MQVNSDLRLSRRRPQPIYMSFRCLMALAAAAAIWLSLLPGIASAHASLQEASPAAGTRVEAAPSEVRLVFNERIEEAVGALQVLDGKSASVTSGKAVLSSDHRALTLALPKLDEGVYTVSYRIISEDGHPVGGSYVFVVGNPPAAKDASAFDLHAQLGHAGHEAEGALTTAALLLYAVRFIYYAALMFAAGAAIWFFLYRPLAGLAEPLRSRLERLPGQGLMLAALLYVFMESTQLMEGQAGSEWIKLFTRTSVGITWLSLLVLAAAGLMVPARLAKTRALWALLLLAQEAWSGHAAALEPMAVNLALDYIHLIGAALWAGGLMLLLSLWAGDRKEAGRFAASFTRAAWISIAVLTLSGIAMTLLWLTDLSYLFITPWGVMLLVKTGLVVLVAVTGAFIRRRMKRSGFPSGAMLKADGILMSLILIVVGAFTYLSPLPANEPVAWHQMGSALHVSIRIAPNVPGDNEFTTRVWMFNKLGAPKSVKLRLISEDKPDMGPIEVPVEPFKDDEISTFDGYTKFAYKVKGPYLPFAGKWTVEVRVLDSNDDEHVERTSFRNY
ncbi:copper resistance CopC/CopD family protein [Paenibacillus sp. D51F]